MCRPKSHGGLGITNTSIMNKCLIIKWWWRIMHSSPGVLWFDILKFKYFPTTRPMFASASHGSQFWRDLVKVFDEVRAQVKFVVNGGKSVRFWLDWWFGDSPLCSIFPVLFSFCSKPEISISELVLNNWDFGFHRSLSPAELDDWHRLVAVFPTLSETPDSVIWHHTASGRFTVKSLYFRLVSGTSSPRFNDVWRARIPLKIKKFLWQAIRGRLPIADQIRKRNGPASKFCSLCSRREDSDHILFNCDFADLLWSCTRSWLGVKWAPCSFAQLLTLANTLSGQLRRLFWFGFAAMSWALWTTRNKFTIEHVFPSKSADVATSTPRSY